MHTEQSLQSPHMEQGIHTSPVTTSHHLEDLMEDEEFWCSVFDQCDSLQDVANIDTSGTMQEGALMMMTMVMTVTVTVIMNQNDDDEMSNTSGLMFMMTMMIMR